MITVHHLGVSQSERIVWLCEELAIPYTLKRYDRDATTRLAPPDYKALHPRGIAPVIADIMMLFPLSTMRAFAHRDLSPLPHLKAYMQRIGERSAYRRAMEKGDPGISPMLT